MSSVFRVAKKLFTTALSQQLPGRLIEPRIPRLTTGADRPPLRTGCLGSNGAGARPTRAVGVAPSLRPSPSAQLSTVHPWPSDHPTRGQIQHHGEVEPRSPPPRRSILLEHTLTGRDFSGCGRRETLDQRILVDRRNRGKSEQVSGPSVTTGQPPPYLPTSAYCCLDLSEM